MNEAIEMRNAFYDSFERINNIAQVLNLLKQDKSFISASDIFFRSTANNFLPLFVFKKTKGSPAEILRVLKQVNPKLSNVLESSQNFIAEIKKIGHI